MVALFFFGNQPGRDEGSWPHVRSNLFVPVTKFVPHFPLLSATMKGFKFGMEGLALVT